MAASDAEGSTGPRPLLNLFRVSLPICAVVALLGIFRPDWMSTGAQVVTRTSFRALDWFFMASVTGFLIFSLVLALGPWGKRKLGKADEQPEFSTVSWLAMLFSAGMGAGLLFWGAAEPIMHFSTPPTAAPFSPEAARQAMVITAFHWGLQAWAVYCVGALVLGYFSFRLGSSFLAGGPLRAAYKGRWVEPVAKLSDLVAVLAVAFGVAGSMGMGVLQLHTGLSVVFGLPLDSTPVAVGILVVLVISYMISATTSLDKGIRILSNVNMALAIGLMAFLFLAGPSAFLMRAFVTAVGDYLTSLPALSLSLYPYRDMAGWLEGWTLTYFIWWIAWAPFVGIFIARISRGRTIREFVFAVLFAPTLFSLLWFAVFGGTALHEELAGVGGIADLVHQDVTTSLFALMDRLPLAGLLNVVCLVLIFVFLVTSVDSATFVLGMLTSQGSLEPPTSRKVGWGITLGVMGGALLLSGNVRAVQAVAISGAIPFTFVLLLQCVALIRVLRAEGDR
jgi:glycine betaine transporter